MSKAFLPQDTSSFSIYLKNMHPTFYFKFLIVPHKPFVTLLLAGRPLDSLNLGPKGGGGSP